MNDFLLPLLMFAGCYFCYLSGYRRGKAVGQALAARTARRNEDGTQAASASLSYPHISPEGELNEK